MGKAEDKAEADYQAKLKAMRERANLEATYKRGEHDGLTSAFLRSIDICFELMQEAGNEWEENAYRRAASEIKRASHECGLTVARARPQE